MSKGILPTVSAVTMLAITVTACSAPGVNDAKQQTDGTASDKRLVVAEQQAPATLDPIDSGLNPTWRAWQFSYETLTLVNESGELEPMLAETWEQSDDGLEYRFKLRKGVNFSNGEVMTAKDVAFSFERLMTEGAPYGQTRFESLKSVEALSDHEVKFTLDKQDSGFLYNLGNPFVVASAIVSQKGAEDENLDETMVGTGPYKMTAYTPNVSLELEVRDDYWGDRPKQDALEIRYMPDLASQVSALMAGQVDLIIADTTTYPSLQNRPNIEIQPVTTARVTHLHLNSAVPPLDNVDVRRAIALAIDREALVAGAFHGHGEPSAHIPPVIPWAPDVASLPYHSPDPVEAKRLLAQAGYPDGLELTLMHRAGGYDFLDRSSVILQEQFAKAGITITIEPQEQTVWLDRMNSGDYEITDDVYGYEGNPYYYMFPRPGRQGPNPEGVETALNGILDAPADEAQAAFLDAQTALAEEVFPDLGLVAIPEYVAYNSELSGVEANYSMDRRFLYDVTLP